MSHPSTKSNEEAFLSTNTLPKRLQEQSQWVCWTVEDDGMVGFDPLSGEAINTLYEGSDLDDAERELETSDHDGVAFTLLPDSHFVAIRLLDAIKDLDDAEVKDWVEEVIEKVDSYTEAGPFGDDLLLLIEGDLPDGEFESDKIQFTTEGVIPLSGRSLENYDTINHRQNELEAVFEEHNEWEPPQENEDDEDSIAIDQDVTLNEVRETVVKNFDEAQWHLTEAILSTHATLCIGGIQNCVGLMVVGDSGAGKTTALRFFEGLDEQFYRSDEVTPASFVSHDASLSDEELAEVDLLPRIQHKSLLCRDMETWFSGDRDSIRSTMSRMTHLMDGEGLTRDSGSHGQRGYEGDLRFSFIGASTPLSPRAWEVMGNAGYRFVFYHKDSPEDSKESLKESLFGETNYQEQVKNCRTAVRSFLYHLWDGYDGYSGVPDSNISTTEDAQEAIAYLGQVVKFCRATIGDDDIPKREDSRRIGAVLRDIAKGRALLDERTEVTVDDVVVSARVALSTMPNKRRPLVRALLNPSNGGQLTRKEAQDALGVSKPTAITRMKLMDTLDIAEFEEDGEDGRSPKRLVLKSEFEWPDLLMFPER